MLPIERAYYLRRATQEQQAALAATCTQARERHEELAAAYQVRCRLDLVQSGPVNHAT